MKATYADGSSKEFEGGVVAGADAADIRDGKVQRITINLKA